MIYKQFDIVVVPFPFTDKNTSKKRPAVVLSVVWFKDKLSPQAILEVLE